ncbi:hypothetical protein Leryth_017083 [Lithospermum erythrorhizon]|nr:hypothetical protein Leryth_017083 [Lithospermum erythrorhizon]
MRPSSQSKNKSRLRAKPVLRCGFLVFSSLRYCDLLIYWELKHTLDLTKRVPIDYAASCLQGLLALDILRNFFAGALL